MQPISVTVGPLAASVANNISLSQTPPAGALLLNGSLAVGAVSLTASAAATGTSVVAVSGPLAGAQVGATVTDATTGSAIPAGTYIKAVIGASLLLSNSVTGLLQGDTLQIGGVAVLDKPRTLLFTSSGNNSTSFFTITGADWAGNPISEVLQGANIGTKTSLLSYATVTSIVSSASSAAGLTVGTASSASSPWVRLDSWASPQTLIQNNTSGTVNYTVQQTLDDPGDPVNPVAPANMTWFNTTDPALVNATASTQSNYAFAPVFVRIVLNSGTGSVTSRFNQSSDVNL